jgi:hypothetical protein
VIGFLLAGLCAVILPWAALTQWGPQPFPTEAWRLGVIAAILNGLIAYITNRLAIGHDTHIFLRRAALGHGTRLALLGGLIFGVILTEMPSAHALIVTVFIGYFSFLASEIALLHSRLYGASPTFFNTES